MAFRLSIRRTMLLAGTLGTLTVYPALAQQQPAPAAAPAPARKPPRSIRSRCRPAPR